MLLTPYSLIYPWFSLPTFLSFSSKNNNSSRATSIEIIIKYILDYKKWIILGQKHLIRNGFAKEFSEG